MGNLAHFFGGKAFDTDRDDAATGFDPLPPGWYPVTVDAAEIKANKAGNGKGVKVELTIVGDKFANRKLFPWINIENPNQTCVDIGFKELAALGLACGFLQINDTSELVGKAIQVRVKIEPAKGDYEACNRVTAYKSLAEGERVVRARRAPAVPATPVRATGSPVIPVTASPGAKRPWER